MVTFIKRVFLGIYLLQLPFFAAAQVKVVGYLTNWGNLASDASKVDYSIVTHINIAFINPTDASGNLGPVYGLSSAVQTIHNNNAKVLASLGGANAFSGSPNWPSLLTDANRAAFVTKISDFVTTYNLDGVDVDLEGDDVNADYAKFISELYDALKPKGKLLTSALGTWFANNISNSTLKKFDWVNSMAYDNYGTWTGPGDHSTYDLAVFQLNYWKSRGVSKDSLVLGVPFYGYKWETSASSAGYCNIVGSYPRAVNQDTIITTTGGFISYNGVPTMKSKTALAIREASGIMIWTLQYDCPATNASSLLKAIGDVIKASENNNPPSVSVTAPATNSVYTESDKITLTAAATDAEGTISRVSFYSGSFKIGEVTSAPYTIQWTNPGTGTYQITAKAEDDAFASATSDAISVQVTAASSQLPFGGTSWPIPGRIEAENFDIGKDLGYYDISAANDGGAYRNTSVDISVSYDKGGGYLVGWNEGSTEWLEYTVNVAKDASYDLNVRIATNYSNRTLHVEMDGQNISGTINVPRTAGWQKWTTITIPNIPLTSGQKVMRIFMDVGGYNLNYVSFNYHVTAVQEEASARGIRFYPNPFTDQATIMVNLPASGSAHISLIDIAGKEVYTTEKNFLSAGSNSFTINGSAIPKGFYICRITQADQVMTVAVSKE